MCDLQYQKVKSNRGHAVLPMAFLIVPEGYKCIHGL